MVVKKRKSQFRGVVSAHSRKQEAQGAQYGYLKLPKNVSVFKDTPGSLLRFDILAYRVTDKRNPDRLTIDDFVVAKEGSLWWRRSFKTHRQIGAAKETVICLASFGQKCPICEYRTKLMNENGITDESKDLRASDRQIYIIVPHAIKEGQGDWKKLESKPQLWTISYAMFGQMLKEELDLNEEHEIFADMEEGETLEVRFSSETFGTGKPFSKTSRIDFKERKEQYGDEMVDELPDLDAIIINSAMSYEALKAKFFEIEPDDEPGEEEAEEEAAVEEEKPTRRSKKEVIEEEPEENEEDSPEGDEGKALRDSIPKRERCVACDGTGKNSRGKTCRICNGTGRKPEKKEEGGVESRCPFGYIFGKDCEGHTECDSCDGALWEECYDAKTNGE